MAYRTFHQEKYYDAPDIQAPSHALAALNTLAQLKAQRQQMAQDLQANYKIGIENGYFPQLQKQINQGAQHLTDKLSQHFAEGGQYIPTEIKNGQAYLSGISKSGETLMNQLKAKQEQIALKKADDPYWNATTDEEKLKQVFNPEFDTPEKIEAHLNSVDIGKNSADYDKGKIVSDWVKGQGKKQNESDITTSSGLKTSSFTSNQFINDKGVHEITTDHVEGLMKKHPMMYQIYSDEAQGQIVDEIKRARANDEDWTKDKTDEELFSDIYHGKPINPDHPMVEARDENNNPVRDAKGKAIKVPMSFGDRIKSLAKQDIAQYEDTHNKSAIDASNYQSGAQYGITSKAYNPPADGFKQGALSGPSRMLVKKTGTGDNRFLYIPASQAEFRYDNDTKQYVKTGVDAAIPFVMTSYQWGPVDAQGKPVVLPATSTDDLIRIINDPKTKFGPEGITGAAPIVSGRAIDKASVLNLAYNGGKLKALEDQVRSNPDDKNLSSDLSSLHEALDNIQADRSFDSQLIQKYIGADVIKNQSFATTKNDPNVQAIQGDTQMNVYDPRSLNGDMKRVKDAIDKRVREASQHKKPEINESSTTVVKTPTTTAVKKVGPKGKVVAKTTEVITPEDFSAKWATLKSGESIIGPDGNTYTKK